MTNPITRTALLLAAASLLAAPAVQAGAVADFYKGKQIRMVMPTSPGGSTALYGTTLARYMERHIPGTPNIIHEYRTGSGGLIAANYVYNAAPRDGLVITMLLAGVILTKQLKPKAAKFELAKFGFIGRMADLPRVLIAWHTTGLKTIEDAKKKQVPLGSSGRSSITTIHPLLMNRLAGTKFKIVTGYRGAGNTYLALERGEIGATTVAWDGLVGNRGDWLRRGKVRVLVRIGSRVLPGYESVPRLIDLGSTPEDKEVLRLTALPAEAGQAVATPPGVPADRLAALRRAFDATMKDPAFLAEAKKRKMVLAPRTGAEVQRFFTEGVRQPAALIERVRKLTRFRGGAKRKRKSKR